MSKIIKNIFTVIGSVFIGSIVGLMIATIFYIFFSHPNTCLLPFTARLISYVFINMIIICGSIVIYYDEKRMSK